MWHLFKVWLLCCDVTLVLARRLTPIPHTPAPSSPPATDKNNKTREDSVVFSWALFSTVMLSGDARAIMNNRRVAAGRLDRDAPQSNVTLIARELYLTSPGFGAGMTHFKIVTSLLMLISLTSLPSFTDNHGWRRYFLLKSVQHDQNKNGGGTV